ncbi:MAG: glycerol-3-phosphate dehydrogenase [Rhizobiales bacterium]|nr:glycerol-3-phosphate dehydrogenase [Hyphomicrobiales bacterium]
MADFDLAIIGGGINGVGIARDAAGRGLRVVLVEQNDLASGTSSASTKLVHGGLRYLEQWAFRLVREALAEREVLLSAAPHLIRPMRFVLPTAPGLRPPLLMRLGLFLYDHLGARKILPSTRTVDLTHHPYGIPLQRRYRSAFEYSDCWVDDARLVVLNAVDAVERGAAIRTRTRCVRAERGEEWRLILNARGRRDVVTARALVNATGPWVELVAETVLRVPSRGVARLVKGSHIVVPRLFGHDAGYILQAADRRVVFALPFERDFTLIGTTDQDFVGDPNVVVASAEEIQYLCEVMNGYFREAVSPGDVVWSFAGVRSLHADHAGAAQDTTRDYMLVLDERFHEAPLLTVYGGKITTYRRLAEAAMGRLGHFFAPGTPWTANAPLPGGDFSHARFDARLEHAQTRWPFLGPDQMQRLFRAYGTRLDRVLGAARSRDDIGPFFGPVLSAAEVRYLMSQEWAETADDVLWRRSKLGLTVDKVEREALARFMANETGRLEALSTG